MYRYRQYFVYILASRRNGTFYTGVTGKLLNRVGNHKNDVIEGFTKRYGVHRLVRFEIHEDVHAAVHREKCVKKWRRAWKLQLIEGFNPDWEDLYDKLL
jgi:putative endonuclease